MDAIILAAGRGTRLRPVTDTLPKPLIEVQGLSLIEIHLIRLAAVGCRRVIINLHHLGKLIQARLGDGRQYGIQIIYSNEFGSALETAGGIINALPLIQSSRFAVISADVLCDYPFQQLLSPANKPRTGHLVMVNNPPHHPNGDFVLHASGDIANINSASAHEGKTFSGLASFHKSLFEKLKPGRQALRPVLETAIAEGQLSGELHSGLWSDIGTSQRLDQAQNCLHIGRYIDAVKRSMS